MSNQYLILLVSDRLLHGGIIINCHGWPIHWVGVEQSIVSMVFPCVGVGILWAGDASASWLLASNRASGTVLGAPWEPFWAQLGPTWGQLGPLWATLSHLGANLGRHSPNFSQLRAKLGPIYGQRKANLKPNTLFEITCRKVFQDRCSPESTKPHGSLAGCGGASPTGDPASEPTGSAWAVEPKRCAAVQSRGTDRNPAFNFR